MTSGVVISKPKELTVRWIRSIRRFTHKMYVWISAAVAHSEGERVKQTKGDIESKRGNREFALAMNL